MKKVMLIAGCSHAAGSEIDGSEDSKFNRSKSFGNQLAVALGYEPINIAICGSTNSTIVRSILEWFNKNDTENTEVFVLVSWTESSRMEVPSKRNYDYITGNPAVSWFSKTSDDYHRINQGWAGSNSEEKRFIKPYHSFIANNLEYLEILSVNYVLQLQYFLESKSINYVMCNTMHMFGDSKHLDFYLGLINKTKYLNLKDNNESFYWKYKNLGYTNPKAKYWHHSEQPHKLFAIELYKFIKKQG
jgi:hypothetical protein